MNKRLNTDVLVYIPTKSELEDAEEKLLKFSDSQTSEDAKNAIGGFIDELKSLEVRFPLDSETVSGAETSLVHLQSLWEKSDFLVGAFDVWEWENDKNQEDIVDDLVRIEEGFFNALVGLTFLVKDKYGMGIVENALFSNTLETMREGAGIPI